MEMTADGLYINNGMIMSIKSKESDEGEHWSVFYDTSWNFICLVSHLGLR